MPTPVMPLRRIRIHKQRRLGTWRVYCSCCWNYNGTGLPEPYGTFEGARDWAILHIDLFHSRAATGGWITGPAEVTY